MTEIERPPEPSKTAFRALFDRHAPYVWRCLRRLGVPAADAEDLCQEVFVVAHGKLAQLDAGDAMRAWLYGVAVRKVWDYRRLAHRALEGVSGRERELPVEAPQTAALERRAASEVLDALLDKLDPKQRDVFVLYEIEELAMPEIARMIGCPLQTAYSRLHAARAQLEAAAHRLRAARSPS